MSELPAMEIANGAVEGAQKGKSGGGDANVYTAAVGVFTAAPDEAAFFEAVQETCDVRVTGDHASGDFTTKQTPG